MPEFGTYSRTTTVEDDARINAGIKGEGRPVPMVYDDEEGSAALWLPHDCDEWVIASGSVEAVIARAEEFRASLDEAIGWLRSRRG